MSNLNPNQNISNKNNIGNSMGEQVCNNVQNNNIPISYNENDSSIKKTNSNNQNNFINFGENGVDKSYVPSLKQSENKKSIMNKNNNKNDNVKSIRESFKLGKNDLNNKQNTVLMTSKISQGNEQNLKNSKPTMELKDSSKLANVRNPFYSSKNTNFLNQSKKNKNNDNSKLPSNIGNNNNLQNQNNFPYNVNQNKNQNGLNPKKNANINQINKNKNINEIPFAQKQKQNLENINLQNNHNNNINNNNVYNNRNNNINNNRYNNYNPNSNNQNNIINNNINHNINNQNNNQQNNNYNPNNNQNNIINNNNLNNQKNHQHNNNYNPNSNNQNNIMNNNNLNNQNNIINNNNLNNQNNNINNNNLNNQNSNNPKYKGYSFSRYTKASLCGLQNLGHTSYLNSVLQLFCSERNVASYFLNPINGEFFQNNIEKYPLSFVIHRLCVHLYPFPELNHREIYKTDSIMDILGGYNVIYKDFEEKNPKDFIFFLLNKLHEELNPLKIRNESNFNLDQIKSDRNATINNGLSNFIKNNDSRISDCFFGFEIKQNQCTKCSNEIYTFKYFPTFALNVSDCALVKKIQNVTIENCLEFYELNKLKKSFCNVCKNYEDLTFKNNIYSSPNYFVFLLDFKENNNNIHFVIEPKINLEKFIENKTAPLEYELNGIVFFDLSKNKYNALSLSPVDKNWYLFDDENVCLFSFNNFNYMYTQNRIYKPYILLYNGSKKN